MEHAVFLEMSVESSQFFYSPFSDIYDFTCIKISPKQTSRFQMSTFKHATH